MLIMTIQTDIIESLLSKSPEGQQDADLSHPQQQHISIWQLRKEAWRTILSHLLLWFFFIFWLISFTYFKFSFDLSQAKKRCVCERGENPQLIMKQTIQILLMFKFHWNANVHYLQHFRNDSLFEVSTKHEMKTPQINQIKMSSRW